MRETPDDVWADVRRRWNQDDLPVLLGKVSAEVVQEVAKRMEGRAALDDLTAESERLGLYGRRWSVADEG